jgi:hypothetical protein
MVSAARIDASTAHHRDVPVRDGEVFLRFVAAALVEADANHSDEYARSTPPPSRQFNMNYWLWRPPISSKSQSLRPIQTETPEFQGNVRSSRKPERR